LVSVPDISFALSVWKVMFAISIVLLTFCEDIFRNMISFTWLSFYILFQLLSSETHKQSCSHFNLCCSNSRIR